MTFTKPIVRSAFPACLCLLLGCAHPKDASRHPGNPESVRILAFGGIPGTGGQPAPGDLKDNHARVDQLPIQAFAFNLTNNKGYFTDNCMAPGVAFTYEDLRNDTEIMKSYPFPSGMSFYTRINISAELQTDWFDDAGWDIILNNIKLASRASAETGAIGFLLDNEQYNHQPFNYTSQSDRILKSFDEYAAQTRKRGRQFAEALCAHVPAPIFIITFGNSHIAKEDWKKEDLNLYHMGLWPAFIDGMMDATVDAEFIDGHEDYSAETYEDFRELRRLIREEGARYSEDPRRYSRKIRAAFPFWLKATQGIEMDLDARDFSKNRHSPDAFEHALHYAMLNSDGWIWLYAVPWLELPQPYLDAVSASRKPHRLDYEFGPAALPAPATPPDQMGLTISAKHRADHDEAVVFAAIRKVYEEVYDFPKAWKFRFDPKDIGEKKKWYRKYDPEGWIDIEIGDWYGAQLDSTYSGYVWYRTTFQASEDWAVKPLWLAFGAVDEQAWIWVNGKKAGQSTAGPSAWNSAFEIDITEIVRTDRPNELVVRVHNKVGPGGIWKSVKIFADMHED